jgi:hypothetical protein
MISDKLYGLAFEYKKTKLWEILGDMDVFAVRLSDGRIGYISIMGFLGKYCALGLYIGDDGFESFRIMAKADELFMTANEFEERIVQQKCLHCAFERKKELSEEEREGVKRYARAHGIRIAGKNAYPQFVKYQPYYWPWQLQTEQEQEDLCDALAAAIELARLLDYGRMRDALGIERLTDRTTDILLLEKKGDRFETGRVKLPKKRPCRFPEPQVTNDISIARLKRMKRAGVWECGIIRCPEPIQYEEEEIPLFPVVMLAVDAVTDYLLPVNPVAHYEEHPEELLNQFIEALLVRGVCPIEIHVRDERTRAFIKSFAARLNIKVQMEKQLPFLEDAEYTFYERFSMSDEDNNEEMLEALETLAGLEQEEIRQLPFELVEQVGHLVRSGTLPEELEKRLCRKFHVKAPETAETRSSEDKTIGFVPEQSYVFSVTLCTGCYRHIKISCHSTLEQLHEAILEAFGFQEDGHCHAFFMDNQLWSEQAAYFCKGNKGARNTDRWKLSQVRLKKGLSFKYLFDFGDEWVFQCKVLRVTGEPTEKPVVIRSKGEAPDQYNDLGFDE